mgnify:FL=1
MKKLKFQLKLDTLTNEQLVDAIIASKGKLLTVKEISNRIKDLDFYNFVRLYEQFPKALKHIDAKKFDRDQIFELVKVAKRKSHQKRLLEDARNSWKDKIKNI